VDGASRTKLIEAECHWTVGDSAIEVFFRGKPASFDGKMPAESATLNAALDQTGSGRPLNVFS
jgi:hypothetical protein